MRRSTKLGIFVVITLACIVVAVTYTVFSARTAKSSAGAVTSAEPPVPVLVPAPAATAPLPPAAVAAGDAPTTSPAPRRDAPKHPARKPAAQAGTYLIALNVRDSPDRGTVEFAAVDSIDARRTTSLRCERIYFARDTGICLIREIRFFSAHTIATVVDASFRPLFDVRADGVPSRARVSPDGRYAAFTVFVTGHSYADTQLSTATLLIDIPRRTTLANLEDFEVSQDGSVVKSPDFNYWGVTFERNSNFFYATLRMRGINYLVHGDIAARTVTVVYKGVECPSLSPDGKRIAFKKMAARGDWRLTVLDLATLKETPLRETRSVDDQAEWLDDERILYALTDPMPWMSIMVISADGTGEPRIFAKGASSPAVVKQFLP